MYVIYRIMSQGNNERKSSNVRKSNKMSIAEKHQLQC